MQTTALKQHSHTTNVTIFPQKQVEDKLYHLAPAALKQWGPNLV